MEVDGGSGNGALGCSLLLHGDGDALDHAAERTLGVEEGQVTLKGLGQVLLLGIELLQAGNHGSAVHEALQALVGVGLLAAKVVQPERLANVLLGEKAALFLDVFLGGGSHLCVSSLGEHDHAEHESDDQAEDSHAP